jgi:transcriptional activator for dhaKLM operon
MTPAPDPKLAAWRIFQQVKVLAPGISPAIAHSWRRCAVRMTGESPIPAGLLSPEHLLAAQVAAFDLISVARPIMEDLYQAMDGQPLGLMLVNSAGYILDRVGEEPLLADLGRRGLNVGTAVTEARLGTNAFGLALLERVPLEVGGAEHFLASLHDLSAAAAPVFDLTGRPLGALGCWERRERGGRFLLALVTAAARAIENQRQSDLLLAEQNSHLAELNAILTAISEGILVWNADGVLMHVNAVATELFGLTALKLLGGKLGELIQLPPSLQAALEQREPVTDVEAALQVGSRAIHCVVSLRFVFHETALQWVIASFKPEREVHRLVQRQLGASAILTLEDIPGDSAAMRRVRRLVRQAAGAQASVLVRGEGGVGKNGVASAIHTESLRREGPFLIFPCASTPNELMMEELLGHAEDAWTRTEAGRSGGRPGGRPSKFELAHGGSLFFQDVDALGLEAQAALLNYLELGLVQRLGSDQPITVDVRVLAASAADMERLTAQGAFRADLFYRLSAFEIRLPPLRERPEDLAGLVERILARLRRQVGHPLQLAPEALAALQAYRWPGNIRELEAVLGRAAVHAGASQVIGPMHLPRLLAEAVEVEGAAKAAGLRSIEALEREALQRAAEVCAGNVTAMAAALGWGRTTVWRKLRAYGIAAADYRRS